MTEQTAARLLAAVSRMDDLGHVGQEVAPDYCDCETCEAQSELRLALEAARVEA